MKPWTKLFDYESILTPLSIERIHVDRRIYRMVYIFGVRVMSMNVRES